MLQFLFILSHLSTSLALSHSIEVPFNILKNTAIYFNISLGIPVRNIPPQIFSIKLDTGSPYFWVKEFNDDVRSFYFDQGFITRLSSTYKNTTQFSQVDLLYGRVMGFKSKDHLTIGSVMLPNFPFILSNNTQFGSSFDGIMGLSYSNETNYLITHLHQEKKINYRIFSFDMKRNMFIIGSIPYAIQKDIENFSYCRVLSNSDNKQWTCILKGIYSSHNNTNFLQREELVEFNTATPMVVIDFNLLYSLYLHFVSNNNKGKCILEGRTRSYEIICNKDFDISGLSDLYLTIDNMNIRIPKEDLFEKYNAVDYVFILKSIPNFTRWIIGYPLLRHFHSVFDMDRGIVGLYSEKDNIIINDKDIDYNQDEILKYYKHANMLGVYNVLFSLIVFICISGFIINGLNKLRIRDFDYIK